MVGTGRSRSHTCASFIQTFNPTSITIARISTEDLASLHIILTELSMSKIIKAKSQNVCTVLYFDFHFCNDEECY